MIINKNFIYFVIVAIGVSALLLLGFGPALIGGMATYLLINSLHNYFNNCYYNNKMSNKFKVNISLILSLLFMFIFTLLTYKSLLSVVNNNKLESMMQTIILLIDQVRDFLQSKFSGNFFININTAEDLKKYIMELIQNNSKNLLNIGNSVFHFILIILLGIIIGALFSYAKLYSKYILKIENKYSINSDYFLMIKYIRSFSDKFKLILYSQFWVAIINTLASIIYLFILLPLFDINIPYKTIAIVVTFIASLIPIIGNLISNTLITILSLTVNVKVAIISLIYLMVLHKFEYVIIAKVIGEKINSAIWEILCALIIFESIFGLAGLVLAPVLYTYIKEELKNLNFFGDKN